MFVQLDLECGGSPCDAPRSWGVYPKQTVVFIASFSKSKPSPGLIMTNPPHVFAMFASNEGCLKENCSKQLLSITMAEGWHLCLAVKHLGFTLSVSTKLLVSDSTQRENRQTGATVTAIKRFTSDERDAHLRTAVEFQNRLILRDHVRLRHRHNSDKALISPRTFTIKAKLSVAWISHR